MALAGISGTPGRGDSMGWLSTDIVGGSGVTPVTAMGSAGLSVD